MGGTLTRPEAWRVEQHPRCDSSLSRSPSHFNDSRLCTRQRSLHPSLPISLMLSLHLSLSLICCVYLYLSIPYSLFSALSLLCSPPLLLFILLSLLSHYPSYVVSNLPISLMLSFPPSLPLPSQPLYLSRNLLWTYFSFFPMFIFPSIPLYHLSTSIFFSPLIFFPLLFLPFLYLHRG